MVADVWRAADPVQAPLCATRDVPLQTARLRLRRVRESDLVLFERVLCDAGMMRRLGWPWTREPTRASRGRPPEEGELVTHRSEAYISSGSNLPIVIAPVLA